MQHEAREQLYRGGKQEGGKGVSGGGQLIHRRRARYNRRRDDEKRGKNLTKSNSMRRGWTFLEVESTNLSVYVKRWSKSTPERPGWDREPSRCFAQLLQSRSAVGWMCLRLSGLSVMKQPWELERVREAE